MNLMGIMLNKESQSQKVTHEWFHLYTFAKRQNYTDGEQINGCQGLVMGGRGKGNGWYCKGVTQGSGWWWSSSGLWCWFYESTCVL